MTDREGKLGSEATQQHAGAQASAGVPADVTRDSEAVVLVPTDFGPASARALAAARELGERIGAEVVLVHVVRDPGYVITAQDPVLLARLHDDLVAVARRSLDELGAASGGLRTMLREGDPADEILAIVDEIRPLLVAMGMHARRGLADLLWGSITTRIVRLSSAPVLAVPERQRKETQPREARRRAA